MSTIQRWLLIALAFAALAGIAYVQHLRLEAADSRAAQAERQLLTAEDTIEQLRDSQQRIAELYREAATAQANLERAASRRESEIRRLQRENQKLREWADLPLPDDVIRMRQRPALIGADDYRQYLSDAEPLHAAGGEPGDQRRPESAGRAR